MLKKKYVHIVFALTTAIILGATGCSDPTGNNHAGDSSITGGTVGGGSGAVGGGDIGGTGGGDGSGGGSADINGSVTVRDHAGWFETLYIKWDKLAGAEKYNVYYRGGAASDWTRINDFLIREYEQYYRADILGIRAGIYDVKVVPVFYNNEGVTPSTVSGIEVKAHDRSGYAFANGEIPGAYNPDGTPKDGARIIYVTENNKDTVTLTVVRESNGREDTFTGLRNILRAHETGREVRPLIIRFIGKITHNNFNLEAGDIMIKDNRNRNTNHSVTLEGVGDDAVAHGWGIRTSRASHLEIRNLGFMLTRSSGGDNIEIQDSRHVWVHHTDMFYGIRGTGDNLKGDGALDIKNSDFVTIAYNHFLDTGKSSLLGNSRSETMSHITYHHNHFNHSDSRHPRVRVHQVHVYNNYFDGVATYGVGATLGSSVFVEGNYFRQTRNPILISRQGTDIIGNGSFNGVGTFSSEDGGMIKAFDNKMDAFSENNFRPYGGNSTDSTIQFDAYVTQSRFEDVPAYITARQGGAIYSNFDRNLPYSYTADSPEAAKEKVLSYAGRYWKGDVRWTFNASDISRNDRNPGIDLLLENYRSRIVNIQGERANSGGDDGGHSSDGGGYVIENEIYTTFGMTTSQGSSVFVTNSAFTVVSGNGRRQNMTINGRVFDTALRLESSTLLTFTTGVNMTLILYTDMANRSVNVNEIPINTDADGTAVTVLSPGNHRIQRGNQGGNLWLIELTP